jgi:hypothetical protein
MSDNKKRPANPKFTTSKGKFKYPRLNEPDMGNDDYPKPNGEYSVQLVQTAEEAKPLIDKLTPLFEKAKEDGAEEFAKLPPAARKKLKDVTVNDFFSTEFDKETEEETGNLIFKFKMTASGVSKKTGKKWSRKPVVFDAKGKPLVNAPSIWGGTIGKVNFEVSPYFIKGTAAVGISLRLQAVQVIELVSGQGRDASDYGFGEEEGYAHEDTAENTNGFGDETAGATGGETTGEEDF